MISLALAAPLLAGLAVLFCGGRTARVLLVGAAFFHLAVCALLWVFPPPSGKWLMADGAGLLFMTLTGFLFSVCSVYACGYLSTLSSRRAPHIFSGVFGDEPEPVFIAFMLFFLAAMSFVCVSRHIALMWVALEATTLASAPLICFHRTPRSLEAAWKYLMICSVAIALALLGIFFISAAAPGRELWHDGLLRDAKLLNPLWLKLAFALAFCGYGAKMGLAPMHTWLPDAHSESPSVISALLSGALLNCAFLSLMRIAAVCSAAGLGEFVGKVFLVFGMASVVIAAALLIRQRDYKRMLAYSSVENMGIIASAVGAGTVYGAVFQAVNHSLAKAMLFLVSGNILRRFRTKETGAVKNLSAVLPASAFLWGAGFIAILGLPPFGIFTSKLVIVGAMLGSGRYYYCAAFLFMLAVVFSAVSHSVMGMFAPSGEKPDGKERLVFIAPAVLLGLCVLLTGIHLPSWLESAMRAASAALGGK